MPKKFNIKHVIFDWAGTLYDDREQSYLATRQVIKDLSGADITREEYKNHFKLPVTGFYERYGVFKKIEELNEIYFNVYEDFFDKGFLYPGVKESLNKLKEKGVTCSVFSTVRQCQLDKLCDQHGIKEHFVHVHGGVSDKRQEIEHHYTHQKHEPEHVIFFGDMSHDVEAANLHNMHSACMLNGYQHSHELIEEKPRFVFNHQNEWPLFLDSVLDTSPEKKAKGYPVSTSGVLIYDDEGKVLLVLTHKWSLTYGIPGGKIEHGETAEDAAIREIKEETNLDIELGELIMVQDCIASGEFYIPDSHFLLFNYVGKALNAGEVKLNDEALSFLWVTPEQALKLHLNEPTRKLIESSPSPSRGEGTI